MDRIKPNPLIDKLDGHESLSETDRDALDRLLAANVRQFEARRDIAREGEPPHAVYAMLEGWACRYKTLADGRRQIVALLLPGDLCDVDVLMLARMDHGIGAVTAVTAAALGPAELDRLLESHPAIARGLHRDALVTVSIQREWTSNVGQRTAYERISHLMCELFFRLRAVGLAKESSCDFPITQTDIADATGLTSVHVNRTIQALRADRLIELRGRRLVIADLPALMSAGLFNPSYLHLGRSARAGQDA